MAFLFGQFVHPLRSNRVQLGLDHRKKLQPLCSDARDGLPLVIPTSRAPYQAPGLQAVYEPGDVGGALDHALGDLAARVAFWMYPAENSQHVVLWTRQPMALANSVDQVIDRLGSDRHAQQSFLLRAGKAGLFQAKAKSVGHPSLL